MENAVNNSTAPAATVGPDTGEQANPLSWVERMTQVLTEAEAGEKGIFVIVVGDGKTDIEMSGSAVDLMRAADALAKLAMSAMSLGAMPPEGEVA